MIRRYKAEIESVVVLGLLAYVVWQAIAYITTQTAEPTVDLVTQILRALELK